MRKQKGWMFPTMMAPVAASLIVPMASLFMQHVAYITPINSITGKRVTRTGKEQKGFLPLLALPLMMKVLG